MKKKMAPFNSDKEIKAQKEIFRQKVPKNNISSHTTNNLTKMDSAMKLSIKVSKRIVNSPLDPIKALC